MKPSAIFWGALLVFLGLFFLLNNFGITNIVFADIIDYWPLILIFWGVSLLKVPVYVKGILAGLSALLISLIIIGSITTPYRFISDNIDDIEALAEAAEFDEFDCDDIASSSFSINYEENVKTAELDFTGAAGEIYFDTLSDNTRLVVVNTRGFTNGGKISSEIDNDVAEVKFRLSQGGHFIKHAHHDNEAIVKLNPDPDWHMKMKVGAANAVCDLTPFKLHSLKLNAKAADINLKIGDKQEFSEIQIDAGVSNIEIEVPEEAGCEITYKTGLSSRDFYGFKSVGNNRYISENYDDSKKKISIRIKGGVSNFEVSRYSK